MTTHQIPATPEQFEQLRQAVTTIEIPYGLEGWHPNEITEWADLVAEDETASADDLARMNAAVFYALGITPEDMKGGA
ncbi:hypothetical protein [Streptomyces rubiginosohelvolus]|uniref:hypothetical protein n=1 Tax=Streptomyces rubiginosohelvolus TaxID=67362 RepID=UPI0035D54385